MVEVSGGVKGRAHLRSSQARSEAGLSYHRVDADGTGIVEEVRGQGLLASVGCGQISRVTWQWLASSSSLRQEAGLFEVELASPEARHRVT